MFSTADTVTHIGAQAARILEEGDNALIHGITSRGIFLLVNSRWVLFLTPEAYHGPLTLNLDKDSRALKDLSAGITVEIQNGRLAFGESAQHLEFGQAVRWEPPERFDKPQSREYRHSQQVEILERLTEQSKARTRDEAVSRLMDLIGPGMSTGEPLFSRTAVQELQRAWRSRETEVTVQALSWFLGRGPGLTPSGDDLVTGMLLALHRWGDVTGPSPDLAELSRTFLPLAYHKTSTLSANLIECAFSGKGDGRLITALDGVMTGNPDAARCAALLQNYGNSSGRDAFLGIILATGS